MDRTTQTFLWLHGTKAIVGSFVVAALLYSHFAYGQTQEWSSSSTEHVLCGSANQTPCAHEFSGSLLNNYKPSSLIVFSEGPQVVTAIDLHGQVTLGAGISADQAIKMFLDYGSNTAGCQWKTPGANPRD